MTLLESGTLTGAPIEVTVQPSVLAANVAALKRHVGSSTDVMVMVKANGFGHGTLTAARAAVAGGATWLGVATPNDALLVGKLGVPVLTVGWTPPEQYAAMIDAGIHISVFDDDSVRGLAGMGRVCSSVPRIHIKIDTGMHRLGLPMKRLEQMGSCLDECLGEVEVTGIYTHFANADGEDLTHTRRQHREFISALEVLQPKVPRALIHCSNSAAALRCPELNHDLVRFGIAAYGYGAPYAPPTLGLRGGMRVVSRVARVEGVTPGTTVGYGSTWKAERASRIATICGGYADGIGRFQSNRGVVLIHGCRCPIVGRVSMSFTTVDVSDVPDQSGSVRTGEEVVLLGEHLGTFLGADEIAERTGSIPNEILCAIAPAAPRRVVDEEVG